MKTIRKLSALLVLVTINSGCSVWFKNEEHGVGQPPPPTVPEQPYLHMNPKTGQWELSDK